MERDSHEQVPSRADALSEAIRKLARLLATFAKEEKDPRVGHESRVAVRRAEEALDSAVQRSALATVDRLDQLVTCTDHGAIPAWLNCEKARSAPVAYLAELVAEWRAGERDDLPHLVEAGRLVRENPGYVEDEVLWSFCQAEACMETMLVDFLEANIAS